MTAGVSKPKLKPGKCPASFDPSDYNAYSKKVLREMHAPSPVSDPGSDDAEGTRSLFVPSRVNANRTFV